MINKVTLIGNLGDAPEIKEGFAKMNVATTSSYKDKQDVWQQQTEWHSCILWGARPEQMTKLRKGSKVYIEGKISYTKKDDKHYTNIRIEILRSLDPTTQGPGQVAPARQDAPLEELAF